MVADQLRLMRAFASGSVFMCVQMRGLLLEHFPALAGWLLCRAGELNLIAELDRHYTGRCVLAGRASSRVYFKFSCLSVTLVAARPKAISSNPPTTLLRLCNVSTLLLVLWYVCRQAYTHSILSQGLARPA